MIKETDDNIQALFAWALKRLAGGERDDRGALGVKFLLSSQAV